MIPRIPLYMISDIGMLIIICSILQVPKNKLLWWKLKYSHTNTAINLLIWTSLAMATFYFSSKSKGDIAKTVIYLELKFNALL